MATTVTPSMRVHGWNVHLVAGVDDFHFGGLYQVPGSNLITFRDVIDEMRLCFDIPGEEDPWENMAFMLVDSPDDVKRKLHSLVADEDLTLPVPGLQSPSPKDQRIVTYHVILHKPCEISFDKPLEDHLKDKCAQHISRPTRRLDSRYVPLNKSSLDPRYAKRPFRRTTNIRRASQSPKRRRSSSSSVTDGEQEDIKNLLIPPKMDLSPDDARQTIETFRHNCLIHADRCAISGKGQSWCITPSVGPGLQACHVVPQQHFHLYPTHNRKNVGSDNEVEISNEGLSQAWTDTWSSKNGILLMNDIRQLFEARLISIHPDTYKIRAFVPYDVITDFNGKIANVSRKVDKMALRYHYDMSCIENMAAQMPTIPIDSFSEGARYLEIRAPLGRTISLPINNNMTTQSGDPAKRAKLDEEASQISTQEEEIQRALSVEYEMIEGSE
ncbi:hypothetical protein FLONG3_7820 [Fusarium longipes]|uniref:HNH nuclease domain-containing protein n=1 Tax=Fusarium longipes TaxID=694270 RepID=A0A395S9U1_9HYPO|nr:hypothetical protein FLONG3_7820 [Fusarium longipes]